MFCVFTAFYRKLERDCNLIKTIWIAIFEDISSDIFAEPINLLIKMSMHSVLILGIWIVFGYWQWKGKSKAGFWIGVKCFIPTIKSDNGHWAGGHPKIWAVRPWFMVIKFLWQTCGIFAGVRVRVLLPERALDGRGHRKRHLHDARRRPGAQSPSLSRWWPG